MRLIIHKNSIGLIMLLIIALASFSNNAKASDPEKNGEQKIRVMGVPQYLFINGLRVEIDKSLGDKYRWLTFAPTLYYRGQKSNSFFSNSSNYGVAGASMELFYRWYPSRRGKDGKSFVSAGGGYSFIARKMLGKRWESFTEDGIDFYRYNNDYWHTQIHSLNLRITGGFHIYNRNHFLIDYYLGLGLKYAISKRPDGFLYPDYDNYALDSEFSGFLFVTGLRFGIGW